MAEAFSNPVRRAVLAWLVALCGCGTADVAQTEAKALDSGGPLTPVETDTLLVKDGQLIFRYETFGDEVYWTDTLGLHEVVEKHADPTTALQVGLNPGQSCRRPGHDAPSELFLIVQQGQVEVEVEAQTMALKSGDSARLDGRSGRSYICQGDAPALVLEVRSESSNNFAPEA